MFCLVEGPRYFTNVYNPVVLLFNGIPISNLEFLPELFSKASQNLTILLTL